MSAPVAWEEVGDAARGAPLEVVLDDVPDRMSTHGDLFAPLLTAGCAL